MQIVHQSVNLYSYYLPFNTFIILRKKKWDYYTNLLQKFNTFQKDVKFKSHQQIKHQI